MVRRIEFLEREEIKKTERCENFLRFAAIHPSSVQMNVEHTPQAPRNRFDWRKDLEASRDLMRRDIDAYGYVLSWSRKGALPHAIVRVGLL